MRSKMMFALALTGALVQGGFSQDKAEPPKPKWETSAAAGLTLTSGNSETFLATVTLDTKRKWTKDEFGAGVGFGYGESEVVIDPLTGATDNQKTAQYGNVYAQYNHLFTERLYGGIRADAGYDTIAGVEYRAKISPLLGYYFIKNEKTSLAVEAGPSFVFEELEDEDADSYVALRIGERFEHKFSKTTKIWQSAEYLPDVEDFTDKYLINAELGVDAAITTKLGLRVVLQDAYNSRPAAGRECNDIRLIAGLVYKF